jgi:DNA-binding LacI/PurR family transcriptional regulator
MKRPTILDIARRAGVSKGAVSYALNGRPGVSPATRARILAIAEEMGWVPSSAARALSNDRSDAVGLVVVRSAELLATEPYFMRVVAGIEAVLSAAGVALLLTTAPDAATEAATYRHWWHARRVDGVLMIDMRLDDPRPALVRELHIPATVLGAQDSYPGLSAARTDDGESMTQAVRHLMGLGHERIARVSGPRQLTHAAHRGEYFAKTTRQLLGRELPQLEADYTASSGLAATRELLDSSCPPTAIIYDNDVMAVAAVSALVSSGVRVPADVAVLAWDDSPLCELVRPAVTAFRHDVAAEAGSAARLLLEHIETGVPADRWLAHRELTVRGSTDPEM